MCVRCVLQIFNELEYNENKPCDSSYLTKKDIDWVLSLSALRNYRDRCKFKLGSDT